MGTVVDPGGVRWRVRRRWYPWRRRLPLRSSRTGEPASRDAAETGRVKPDMPKNIVGRVVFLLLGVVVWIVVGVSRVVFLSGIALVFLSASLVELVLAVLIMPIAVLLRSVGAVRWPVEIVSGGKYFATQQASGFAAAGDLRDRLAGEISAGSPPPGEPLSAA